MAVDFRDAAKRHWDDAGHLTIDSRHPNADHLFGIAAECALKAVMGALGMRRRPSGDPDEARHRVHIDRLWDEFRTFASGRSAAHYVTLLPAGRNPFHNWDASQRYSNRSQFVRATVVLHQQGAEATMQVLQRARLDGII